MADNNAKPEPQLSLASISAVFAHDLSTPVTTAILNAELLIEYNKVLKAGLESNEGKEIPAHIKLALEKGPELIVKNLNDIQKTIQEYKNYLNALAADENFETSETSNKPHESSISEHARLSILLVDDEEIHHDIGESVLCEKHEIKHDFSGEDALHRCQNEQFDIILMDMQMPSLPGPQTVEQLKTFISPSTLIFGLTIMPIASHKQQLLACGFDGFLEKPLKLDKFDDLLSTLIRDK